MPFLRFVLVALLLAPAASVGASADVYCRTYVWRVGNRTCWRRVCWRAPEPTYTYRPQPAPYWSEPPTAPSWNNDRDNENDSHDEYETTTAPAEEGWQPSDPPSRRVVDHLPSLPRIPPTLREISPEFLFITGLIGVGIFLGRALSFARAVAWQRRADRIHERTLSARALERRMRQDAETADQLIARYTDAAYRRGRSY